MIVVHVKRPTPQWNRQPELVFLIALAAQRDEAEPLRYRKIEKWTAYRRERRRLVILAPKASKDPVQMRDADRPAQPRARGILCNGATEVRKPRSHCER
jgi:hypothetical protein